MTTSMIDPTSADDRHDQDGLDISCQNNIRLDFALRSLPPWDRSIVTMSLAQGLSVLLSLQFRTSVLRNT